MIVKLKLTCRQPCLARRLEARDNCSCQPCPGGSSIYERIDL
jgi:hypothetical protein